MEDLYYKFPNIGISKNSERAVIETWLRKKGTDRKWYLWHHKKNITFTNLANKEMQLNSEIANLIRAVYTTMVLGVVNKTHIKMEGSPLTLDPDQRSEKERLKKFYT